MLLYVVNVAWFFCLHRLHLARAARDAGFTVHVATAPDFADHVQRIRGEGFHFHPLKLRRGRWSVFEECRLAASLWGLYRRVRPDIVHHVTIKPVLCGTLAARLAAVPAIVNSVSGLGFVFTATDRWSQMRRRAVERAYKTLLARCGIRVIFENRDDLQMFVARRIVNAHQALLIRGVGVDLERFRLLPPRTGVPLIVLPARMLWDKGLREFCGAAVSIQDWLREQHSRGVVEWWGLREDMVEVYAAAHVVCLPSYREGLPTVLLEAAACGCALVATDVPGCREVVRDGDTGLLVAPRNPVALADALRTLILDPPLCARLSAAAYKCVSEEFSAEHVRHATNGLYAGLLNQN